MPRAARALALLLSSMLLAACQPDVRLMPAPLLFTTGQVDPFRQIGASEQNTELPVLYATNRQVLIEHPEPLYSIFPSDTLRLGVAHVRAGDGSLDWAQLHKLSTSTDERRRPRLRLRLLEQLATLEPAQDASPPAEARAFFARVNQALARSPHKNLIVYVHGANTAPHRATAQAAQFRHFTGREAVVLSFVWPSAERLRNFATDVRHAADSEPAFARLVELLAANTEAEHLDVLAYSAGAQIASGGLALLGTASRPGEARAALRQRLRLGQVYYAAPDEDTRAFVADLERYVDLTERVTVAGNLHDATLALAARHQGASRIGRPDPTELDAAQTRFLVDASQRLNFDVLNIDPGTIPGLSRSSHSFWMSHPWVSSDVVVRFQRRLAPLQRGLEMRATSQGLRYWTFPKDYDQRLKAALQRRA